MVEHVTLDLRGHEFKPYVGSTGFLKNERKKGRKEGREGKEEREINGYCFKPPSLWYSDKRVV